MLEYFSLFEKKAILSGVSGLLFVFTSLILFLFRKNWKWILFTLITGSFLVHLGAAFLDPYINWWDEQFHALVGKNLTKDFSVPILISNPVLEYDYTNWTANHIWLHKQPLFLWQIGLSIKLFGANEFAVRFPSVLMATLLTLVIFRIGWQLKNKETGWIASTLFSLNYFGNNLISGYYHTDHNDYTFLFYIILSIWSLIEYLNSPNRKWLILIGLFSGFAVLTKWLTGLLVFAVWGLVIMMDPEKRKSIQYYLALIKSFVITILIALPWQLYILSAFPKESKHEFEHASRHFNEVIEGHDGGLMYHFEQLEETVISIPGGYWLLIILFIFGLILIRSRENKILAGAPVLVIFLFFTLAKTKMPAFTYCVTPFIWITIASVFSWVFFEKLNSNTKVSKAIFILILGFFAHRDMKLNVMRDQHTTFNPEFSYRTIRTEDVNRFKELDKELPNEMVLFNCRPGEGILCEFYTGNVAYEFLPEPSMIYDLIEKGITVGVFDSSELAEEYYTIKDLRIIQPSIWK